MENHMDSSIVLNQSTAASDLPVEIVERKGIGHPDTLADALAERMSVAYSRMCRETFGAVLHHNLDKVYLRGGSARTGLGEFTMIEPVTLVIGGRVSSSFGGQQIAYRELFDQVAREYLATVLPTFDATTWLKIEHATTDRSRFPTWFQPRSLDDLPELTCPTSSDTVAVSAWAPYSPTETLVLALERYLNQEGDGPRYGYLGQDVKVMAYRRDQHVDVTVNVAVHPDHAPNAEAYDQVIKQVRAELSRISAHACPGLEVSITINTQHESNPYGPKKHYLLGSGSCLEFGEEGFVGRGNGVSGLIPIQRPKSAEAAFGKNPVYHSGKVYAIYCARIADRINEQLQVPVTVTIAAKHSGPLREPSLIAVDTSEPADLRAVNEIVADVLGTTDHLAEAIDNGRLIPR
jgi:S-adenosylmethionine synthetase